MQYCKVFGCRYSTTHVTSSHQCGKCNMFGHGQRECQKIDLMKALQQDYQTIPSGHMCEDSKCLYPYLHTTEGHCCLYCGNRDKTHKKFCPVVDSTCITTNPHGTGLDITEEIKTIPIKIGHYLIKSAGMGCIWFVRNNNRRIEYFFMHSDSWGQYGEDTNNVPRLNCFLHGYKLQQSD